MCPWLKLTVAAFAFWIFKEARAGDPSTYYSSQSGQWTDPGTWGGANVPNQDPGGHVVVLNHTVYVNDDVTVTTVTVSAGGVLACSPRGSKPVTLTAGRVVVENGGCFTCTGGSSAARDCGAAFSTRNPRFQPYNGPRFTLRLASSRPPVSPDDDIRTLLIKNGAALVLAGETRGHSSMNRLAEHAMAGDSRIVVAYGSAGTLEWRAGDAIAIGPTDYHPDQTEYFRLISVDRSSDDASVILEIDGPLRYARTGKAYGLIHPTSTEPKTFVLDMRAEVALLSRNIAIEGTSDDPDGLKGDVKVTGDGARAFVSWTIFNHLGRRGHMGRYPLHFHGVGSGGVNIDVRNVVVHRSSQRGIVVHCTNSAIIAENVVAHVEGFAYMLEDGAEEDNALINNWALDVRAPDSSNEASLLTERENPAGFWFVNAANTFVGNVAAGVRGSGFSLDLDPRLLSRPLTYTTCPEMVPGFDARLLAGGSRSALGRSVYRALASKAFIRFENNTAHAAHTGLWMIGLPQPWPRLRVENFLAWKIAPRSGPGSIAFDACMRLSGLTGMRINRFACANSALSYWSTEYNVVTNSVLAWLTDGRTGGDAATPQLIPSGMPWQAFWGRHAGMQSYLSNQAFFDTYAYGNFPAGSSSSAFSVGASGSLTGAHNVITGFRREAATTTMPVLLLDARMQHVYTDGTGDLLGEGAGSRALCSCPGCSDIDPLIEAYTSPGQCSLYASDLNDRRLACSGAPPIICRSDDNVTGAPSPSFATVELRAEPRPAGIIEAGEVVLVQASLGQTPVPMARPVSSKGTPMGARFWRFLAPITKSSSHGVAGGYRVTSRVDWANARSLSLIIGPTTEKQGAVTIVVSRVPRAVAIFADRYPWRDVNLASLGQTHRLHSLNGTDDWRSCPSLMQTSCKANADQRVGDPCVCQSPAADGKRDIYVRFRTWGGMDMSILNDQVEPYVYKLTSVNVRLQFEAQIPRIDPPYDLLASVNIALQDMV